jgi:tripartite-type tricarboxylate transporter receptor subunit TctC
MIIKWLRRLAVLSACISAGALAQGSATDFPSRPIRLIVPFAPGGGNDNVARTIGKQLTAVLGQGVVVDNRAGAGGTIGAEVVARAKPDGYTLFLGGVGSHAINPNLQKNLPYDPIKDFSPIILLARAPMVLVAHPKLKLHTVQELIAMAKAEPGVLNYASNGTGSSSHLAAAMFTSMADINMVHVPYKGLSPALTDLIAGTVPIMFSSVVAILPHVKDGTLVALGVTSDKRMPLLPNVPTIAESGVPGYETSSWYGILAPANTPRDIVLKLNAALNKALADPEIQKSLSLDGAQPVGGTPEEFAAHIKREKERLGAVIVKAGITAE